MGDYAWMKKSFGNPEAPYARHLIRWKWFDPGKTWDEWVESLKEEIEFVKALKEAGAELLLESAGDDYWWYSLPTHYAKELPNEEGDWDDNCACGEKEA